MNPIRRCNNCSRLFWAGLPVLDWRGFLPSFQWKPEWAECCSPECWAKQEARSPLAAFSRAWEPPPNLVFPELWEHAKPNGPDAFTKDGKALEFKTTPPDGRNIFPHV